jgi:hypothetical protein
MICPCCGQVVTPPGRLQALMAEVGPVTASVLRELLAADAPLSGRELGDRVYRGVSDGGPDNPQQVICMAVKALRPRLEAIGWTIRASAWKGYRLAPAADDVRVEGGVS